MLFPTRYYCHVFKIARLTPQKKKKIRAVLTNKSIRINSGPKILRSCFLHWSWLREVTTQLWHICHYSCTRFDSPFLWWPSRVTGFFQNSRSLWYSVSLCLLLADKNPALSFCSRAVSPTSTGQLRNTTVVFLFQRLCACVCVCVCMVVCAYDRVCVRNGASIAWEGSSFSPLRSLRDGENTFSSWIHVCDVKLRETVVIT